MHFHRRREFDLPADRITDEKAWATRRAFLKGLGLGGLALAASRTLPSLARAAGALDEAALARTIEITRSRPLAALHPARRDDAFAVQRELTDEMVAARYNNYYEFSPRKSEVWRRARDFQPWPWEIEVTGHAERTGRFDLEKLIRDLGVEERVYRFRCVEAWAMTVPWTGVPLSRLLQRFGPTSRARFVRFLSFDRPAQAPGQEEQDWYPWPYYEALHIREAMNELSLAAVGIYGHPLPNQHGAPLRIVVPWKYGYKGAKGVVRIDLVEEKPATFWNDLAPDEYGFLSNVDPGVPHPRWSQATERLIGTDEEVPTRLFNGYGKWVARLYPEQAGKAE